MTRLQPKSERIEARASAETLAVVRRAAELQGRSVSAFILTAAEQAANLVLAEDRSLRLSPADQARFVEALLDPASPVPAMQRALDHHRRLTGSG